jgi:hypothetical protein
VSESTEETVVELTEEPPVSLPPGFHVTLSGWENDNAAERQAFGEGVANWVAIFSRYLDLSRLERVIVAWDYQAAVASVDGGGGPPSAPTSNEYGEGAAMARHVIRDDEIWSVVIVWTPLVRQLLSEDEAERSRAVHMLFHELVHVDDLRLFSRTYPGGWRTAKPRDGRDRVLQSIVNPCQSEYSAQRRSAALAPEYGFALLDMLAEALREVDDQIRAARLAYRVHGDMNVYWPIVEARLTFLFQAIGYGLGHADWAASAAEEEPELAARYASRVTELAGLPSGWLLEACRPAVLPFLNLAAWEGQEIYDALIAVAERLLNQYGMYTSPSGTGIHVNMPYTGLHDL